MRNVENFLNSWAKGVVRQQKNILASKNKNVSKKLSNSLKYNLSEYSDGYVLDFFMEPYGKFVDKGVSGKKTSRTYIDVTGKRKRSPYKYRDKQPPAKVFDKWIIKRGIAPRDEKGRFITRESLKFLIARSIFFKGIKATSFFSKPLSLALKTFNAGFKKAIIKQIENDLKE